VVLERRLSAIFAHPESESQCVVANASAVNVAKVLLSGSMAEGRTTSMVMVIPVIAAAAIPQAKRGVGKS
jgi:hypothetical protein